MYLTRHWMNGNSRWAVDGVLLAPSFTLGMLLEMQRARYAEALGVMATGEVATGRLLAPIESKSGSLGERGNLSAEP